ncbi:MAG: hypothetical protein V3U54_07690 [Thermodesulfobacteriota bacterium]
MKKLSTTDLVKSITVLRSTAVRKGDIVLLSNGTSCIITGDGMTRKQIKTYLSMMKKDLDRKRSYVVPKNVRKYVIKHAANNLDAIDLLEKYGFLQI